jgi:hypothetical protein
MPAFVIIPHQREANRLRLAPNLFTLGRDKTRVHRAVTHHLQIRQIRYVLSPTGSSYPRLR